MTKVMKELEKPGWQVVASLTATWPVLRLNDDVFGDFRAAAKAMLLHTVLESLRQPLVASKSDFVADVKLIVANHLPGPECGQVGAALLAAPVSGRRLGSGVAQRIGQEIVQALDALQAEAYQRMVSLSATANADFVESQRDERCQRPTWMPKEAALDAGRAALVKAGSKQTLWRRIRGGSAVQFDIPAVPPTEPQIQGSIVMDGSIAALVDRSRKLTFEGACKASPLVRQLDINQRTFNCQVEDAALFARIRTTPPGQSISLEADVADCVIYGGELQRTFLVTA